MDALENTGGYSFVSAPDKAVKIWNSYMPNKVLAISRARQKKIYVRLRDDKDFLKHVSIACRKILDSDFLSGRSGSWRCTFDWLIENDTNYLKVLEGNYDNRKAGDKKSTMIKGWVNE